ncbi:MAG: type II secretion system protein GspC, partial [Gammaproteobacteria bacterium]|nr:type II secretion system protein GspC [Gammaproteobacteria bacterium]
WSDFSGLDVERAIAAANRVLPRWVALALVVAIAWRLAQVIWMLMPGSAAGDQVIAPPAQISRSSPAAGSSVDVQSIAAAHLFGEANAEPVTVQPAEDHENLADTRLNLSLKGTIAATEGEQSIAIIADARNEEKIYSIRDTVAPGATLHAVYADRVVLNRGGALEVLRLPKEFPQGSSLARRDATTVSRTVEAETQSIQEVVTENATRLADVIRPTPYYVSGQMQGYRVYPGRDRRQFQALGLRPGDLIKDIDGQALTNPQQATQIFQELGDKDQVSVTVERNGQPEVLTLQTSQLELDDSQ